MSKELTPLEALEIIKNHCEKDLIINVLYSYEKELKIIKTALKRLEKLETALEIIKEKTQYFIDFEEDTKTIYIDCGLDCDNQEYALLKEVLLWD